MMANCMGQIWMDLCVLAKGRLSQLPSAVSAPVQFQYSRNNEECINVQQQVEKISFLFVCFLFGTGQVIVFSSNA